MLQVVECVTVAAAQTTLTSCTRRSVIAVCALVGAAAAAKTAAAASAVTIAMETAPPLPPPTGTEAGTAGIATTLAQISIRVTAGATTPAAAASQLEVRISLASHMASLARLLILHHQGVCSL